jgi:hypothetical protein
MAGSHILHPSVAWLFRINNLGYFLGGNSSLKGPRKRKSASTRWNNLLGIDDLAQYYHHNSDRVADMEGGQVE